MSSTFSAAKKLGGYTSDDDAAQQRERPPSPPARASSFNSYLSGRDAKRKVTIAAKNSRAAFFAFELAVQVAAKSKRELDRKLSSLEELQTVLKNRLEEKKELEEKLAVLDNEQKELEEQLEVIQDDKASKPGLLDLLGCDVRLF